MMPAGATCLRHATIEMEHHFLGNNTGVLFATKGTLQQMHHELLAMALDLCILGMLSQEDSKKAKGLLVQECEKFYVQHHSFDCKKAKAAGTAQETVQIDAVVPLTGSGNDHANKRCKVEVEASSKAMLGMMCTAAASSTNHFHSSDKDSGTLSDEEICKLAEEELQEQDKQAVQVEFKQVFKSWIKHEVNWHELHTDKNVPEHPDVIGDLMGLDIGILCKKLESDKHFGLLPMMASCSLG